MSGRDVPDAGFVRAELEDKNSVFRIQNEDTAAVVAAAGASGLVARRVRPPVIQEII